ncbi:MAG: hypothetical protein AAGB29_04360 [Planctomycetota bacterium]
MQPTPEDQGNPIAPTEPRRRGRWRTILKAFAACFLLAAAALGYAAWQVRSTPAHYQQHLDYLATTTPDQRHAIAEKALGKFDAVVTLASGGRFGTATSLAETNDLGRSTAASDTPQANAPRTDARSADAALGGQLGQVDTRTVYTVEMSPEELNVLLNEELGLFLDRVGKTLPGGIANPMLASGDDGRLIATFTAEAAGVNQVMSAYFRLRFMQSGEASIAVERFDAGQLPIPAGRLGEAVAERTSDDVQKVAQFLADLEDYRFNPVLTASGGHELQVVGFRQIDAGYAFDVKVLDGGKRREAIATADS